MKRLKILLIGIFCLLGITNVEAYEPGTGVDIKGDLKYKHYYVMEDNNSGMIKLLSHNVVCEVKNEKIDECLNNYKNQLIKDLEKVGGDVSDLEVSFMTFDDYRPFLGNARWIGGTAGGEWGGENNAFDITNSQYWLAYTQKDNKLTTNKLWINTTFKDHQSFDLETMENEQRNLDDYLQLKNGKYIYKYLPTDLYDKNVVYAFGTEETNDGLISTIDFITQRDVLIGSHGVRPVVTMKKSNIIRTYNINEYWFQETNSKIIMSGSQDKINYGNNLSVTDNKEELIQLYNKEKIIESYDINVLNENNEKVQPKGKVKIKIPIPQNIDSSKMKISRADKESGKVVYFDFKIEDNYAVIETDHFSNYVISESNKTTKNEKNPNTGDSTLIYLGSLLLLITAITICSKKLKTIKNH